MSALVKFRVTGSGVDLTAGPVACASAMKPPKLKRNPKTNSMLPSGLSESAEGVFEMREAMMFNPMKANCAPFGAVQ
jgi:hypothetical protein